MNRTWVRLLAVLLGVILVAAACDDDDDDGGDAVEGTTTTASAGEAEEGASVSFASPEDGAEVTSPVTVEMEAEGITIEPAGEVREGAGHFHVMVDVGCVERGETIPGDTEGYHHFGKAQTEAELELEPGEHTLCLQVGDGAHTALDLTHEIAVTVVEG